MVIFTGHFNRHEANEIYSNCRVGIIIYQPISNHIYSQPNKLFEYMAAGLPIVCSNFELWKEIVEDNNCGICVDPTNSEDVRKACEYLVEHYEEGEQMGKNGRKAVETKFNWNQESVKLIDLYKELLYGIQKMQ